METETKTVGFLLIDKPADITSHDVIYRVRKITSEKRVGHAGTLDPFATGLLIVGVGREATREMSKLVGLDKTYEAEFILGGVSDTDDATGKVQITNSKLQTISKVQIEKILKTFLGEIEQVPPQYAAIKIQGVKMYEAARRGVKLEAKPRPVRVDRFELIGEPVENSDGTISIKVIIDCGSGTYVRALARDLGEKLGVGGFVSELRRTKIGSLPIKEAVGLDELGEDWERQIRPIDQVLARVTAHEIEVE
ncbi:tRNA pseudouridine(55) synthase TruB [Patescibacteria group bacterium]|nr:tRNA pseudouridine(55) synthase TruB [Patescibacteria group bacterium]MBU1705300.1 tRNA pseudouridine(55) synthase TruB [Patescibacteria group bacterium]